MADTPSDNQNKANTLNVFQALFFTPSYLTGTDSEIRAWQLLNRVGYSAQGFPGPNMLGAGAYATGVGAVNHWMVNEIAKIKNFHMAKFRYKGIPKELDIFKLEEILFHWGKVAITKLPDGAFHIGTFKTRENKDKDKWDQPHKIDIYREGNKGKSIKGTVGKDSIVIYHDRGQPFVKTFLGPLFRIWPSLSDAYGIYLLIIQSASVNRRLFVVPPKTSLADIAALEALLTQSTKSVIPLGKNPIDYDGKKQGQGDNPINERGQELIRILKDIMNRVYVSIGAEYNGTEKAERVNTLEIDMDSQMLKAQRETELSTRNEGLKVAKDIWGWKTTVYFNPKLEPKGPDNSGNTLDNKGGKSNDRR